jgi:hypothetical protein
MRRVISTILLVVLLAGVAAAMKPGLMHGKLVRATQGSEGTQVFYRLHILVGRQFYVVEQRPTFFLNAYTPREFFINGPVLVRLTERSLYLMRPNGREMRMTIVTKKIVEDDAELAMLSHEADKPAPSDTVADMLDQAAERNRGLIPRGIPDGN